MARMSDEAFENICNFMTDISYRIRTQAARLLGTFLSVSSSVLLKTLDQTLMSNLRVNISNIYNLYVYNCKKILELLLYFCVTEKKNIY